VYSRDTQIKIAKPEQTASGFKHTDESGKRLKFERSMQLERTKQRARDLAGV